VARNRLKVSSAGFVLRTLLAVLMFPVGAVSGLFSLHLHSYFIEESWRSSRYWSNIARGWRLEITDSILVVIAGSILCARLAWLATDLLALLFGKPSAEKSVGWWDAYLLVAPSLLLGYLIYVSNVDDTAFGPTGLAMLFVCILPSLRLVTALAQRRRDRSNREA
jgi:hypothetical protein